jgi:hypothetical protein
MRYAHKGIQECTLSLHEKKTVVEHEITFDAFREFLLVLYAYRFKRDSEKKDILSFGDTCPYLGRM